MDWKNKLYFGDNLGILREHVATESVDLIYLDPPFNSSATYNVLFKEKSGEESAAQITAFEDTWQWGLESEAVYKEIVTSGPRKLADLMQALLAFLGRNDMMAYLVMMAVRLVELHRVLKRTGSIYLHCDPTASHYIKLLLDAIFGGQNFRNEVVWQRTSAHANVSQRYGSIHDIVFFYSRGEKPLWNQQYSPYDDEYVKTFFDQVDESGRRYFRRDLTAAMSHASSGQLYTWKAGSVEFLVFENLRGFAESIGEAANFQQFGVCATEKQIPFAALRAGFRPQNGLRMMAGVRAGTQNDVCGGRIG
jgi:adenine specific DNA methylase Mod